MLMRVAWSFADEFAPTCLRWKMHTIIFIYALFELFLHLYKVDTKNQQAHRMIQLLDHACSNNSSFLVNSLISQLVFTYTASVKLSNILFKSQTECHFHSY